MENKLRKCVYAMRDDHSMWSNPHYFHIWFMKINGKYGEVPYALIEDEKGLMTKCEYHKIKFLPEE